MVGFVPDRKDFSFKMVTEQGWLELKTSNILISGEILRQNGGNAAEVVQDLKEKGVIEVKDEAKLKELCLANPWQAKHYRLYFPHWWGLSYQEQAMSLDVVLEYLGQNGYTFTAISSRKPNELMIEVIR